MDEKTLKQITDSQAALTATLTTMAETLGKVSARLEKLEGKPAQAAAGKPGGAVPIEGFLKTILEGQANANKPLVEAMTAQTGLVTKLLEQISKTPEVQGQRKSLTIGELNIKGTGLKDEEPVTDDALVAAQQVIAASTTMTVEEKRMQLARIGQLRTAITIGHPGYNVN